MSALGRLAPYKHSPVKIKLVQFLVLQSPTSVTYELFKFGIQLVTRVAETKIAEGSLKLK